MERTKEVLRMISVTVRGWVEEGVISETTIYSWCVLNEPAGWEVRSRTCFKLRTILFLERDLGSLQGQLLPGKLPCYQRAVAAGENVFSLFFVHKRKMFFFLCLFTDEDGFQNGFFLCFFLFTDDQCEHPTSLQGRVRIRQPNGGS